MKKIYLDHSAATPVDKRVLKAMMPYFSDNFYNPSASYLAAKEVSKALREAKSKICHWLGARPDQIVFTSGGTEANNLAIHGVMSHYPNKKVLVSAVEHDSVLMPARQYNHKELPVNDDGKIDLTKLRSCITDDAVLVSVMYANNEVGTIQPLKEVSKIIGSARKARLKNNDTTPLYFHTDACQAAAYLDLHVSSLGVDLMTINAGKIYGPKQAGLLYIRPGVNLAPQILGGGQENNMRSGTENVAGVIGLAEALDLVQKRRKLESSRLSNISKHFIEELQKVVPGLTVNGSTKSRLPNNVHVTIPKIDNERFLMELDEKGVMAAAGSACSASNEEASHVLKAMGKTDDYAYSSIRFTTGVKTTEKDIDAVVKIIAGLV